MPGKRPVLSDRVRYFARVMQRRGVGGQDGSAPCGWGDKGVGESDAWPLLAGTLPLRRGTNCFIRLLR
eukprot:6197132-Pleurochrysis_carterae.AAC.2